MIKTQSFFLTLALIAGFAYNSSAQSTINSPYSQFGVGNIKGSYLPQNRSMGNLAIGVSSIGAYHNINIANPASYSQLRLTVFDVGLSADIQTLNRNSLSENSFNANLSHLAIAVPVTKRSALSFGILPYSNLGYSYKQEATVETTADGPIIVDQVYNGEGGLSKAYLGYGIGLGKNFSIGANMSYLFGNLKQSASSDYSARYVGFLNTRREINNSLGGLTFDVGAQYVAALGKTTRLTLGYTAGVKSTLTNKNSTVYSRFSVLNDTEFRADTVSFIPENEQNVTLPANHNFGISIAKVNKWLIGADFRMADWSAFQINNNNQSLNKTWGFSVGGQIVPNINSVTNYLKLIDYRMGVNYDKTYLNIRGQDIDVKSINFGMGFPLISNRSAFYKINFSTEIGTRGTLDNNLVKENFYTFNLGFTINDRWFQKYKYD
ncbi:MAG: hypothetical protein EOO42_22370 [Flavobacteriales bacterium]|nr:MAG: hypothetical protein EOO42_22370 [Flavobacteriales bacterium]